MICRSPQCCLSLCLSVARRQSNRAPKKFCTHFNYQEYRRPFTYSWLCVGFGLIWIWVETPLGHEPTTEPRSGCPAGGVRSHSFPLPRNMKIKTMGDPDPRTRIPNTNPNLNTNPNTDPNTFDPYHHHIHYRTAWGSPSRPPAGVGKGLGPRLAAARGLLAPSLESTPGTRMGPERPK